MPITHVPKWPVVHPNPSTGMALNNFHIMEYAQIVGFTVGGHLFGYYGARKPLRAANSKFTAFIGLFFGVTFCAQTQFNRFCGLQENSREVKLYGVSTQAALDEFTRTEKILNYQLIDSRDFDNKKE